MSVEINGSKIKLEKAGSIESKSVAEREARLDELASDPAQGGKATPKARREAEVGLELEESGKLKPKIKRDPSGQAEFIDGNGVRWDIKTFDSRFPPKKGGFSLQRDMGKVKAELDKGENVILNTENLSSQHLQELKTAVESLEPALKSRVIWFP